MGRVERVTIPYEPREPFKKFHERPQRWAVIVAHRRAGKTVACINELIRAAVTCPHPNPRFAYIAPLLKQAKDVAWTYLKDFTAPFPGRQVNESELRVDLPGGGRVRIYGADNPDALRGLYLDGVILDEYADMDPALWNSAVRPALSDRQGWAVFIGTPKGHNEFYRIWAGDEHWPGGAQADPEWFAMMLKASETGIVDAAELERARRDMGEDRYRQEYECSFEAAIQGAYYGREMQQAEETERIRPVPHEPRLRVTTAWDLGIGDSTAIWFVQQSGQEVRVIDYYEAAGVGLDHYAKVLSEKPYVYDAHLLPHDAEVKELGTGRTRVETLQSLGITPRIVPKVAVDDGINAVRTLLPRCWFDRDKTRRGVEALKQYRREWDDKLKVWRPRPLHDWTSHGADAFRYLAVGLRPPGNAWGKLKYDTRGVV